MDPVDDIGGSGISLTEALVAVGILAGGVLVAYVVRRVMVRALTGPNNSAGAAQLLSKFVQALLIGLVFVFALNSLGVAITPFLGALGIGGIAVALAVQSVLANAIASVILQIRRPFRRGDQIATNDLEGRVLEINFRTVRLLTFDGNDVLIPSSQVLDSPITNFTNTPVRRSELVIGVDYGTDLEQATRVLCEVTPTVEGVHDQHPPEAWVYEFAESTINVALRFWHASPNAEMWRVRSNVAMAAKSALDAQGITIAFPQRVVHFAPSPPEIGSGAWDDQHG